MQHPPQPRPIGRVNWLGLWTLYSKEVRRFLKVFSQTVAAPVMTTLLFMAIFSLALGERVQMVEGVDFIDFLVPGLIVMGVVQNAFQNTASSIVIAKVQGNIVDVLLPPLGPGELTMGYAAAGVTRGMMVGLATALAVYPFSPYEVIDPFRAVFFAVGAATLLSLIGIIVGIWADKFDQLAAISNFLITPLSFLSGTFYSIDRLPPTVQTIAHLNPFFYMIDGFRSGFIGHADTSPWLGVGVLVVAVAVLFGVVWWMFASGYRLKT